MIEAYISSGEFAAVLIVEKGKPKSSSAPSHLVSRSLERECLSHGIAIYWFIISIAITKQIKLDSTEWTRIECAQRILWDSYWIRIKSK